MKRNASPLIAAAILACALTGFGQKGGPPKITNPVLRASFVYCSPGDLACEAANRVRQDMDADYVHGENSVTAEFQLGSGSRDLTIGLPTTSRAVILDFSVQVHQGSVEPSFRGSSPAQLVKAYINIRGAYYAKENCPAASAVCDCVTHAGMGNWRANGDNQTDYAVLWHPEAPASRPINSPELTSNVNVRYYRDYNGTGEAFVITTIPKDGGYSLSGLEAKKRKLTSGAGQYDMPFTLIARPK